MHGQRHFRSHSPYYMQINRHVSTEEIDQLKSGATKLPLSDQLQLPNPVSPVKSHMEAGSSVEWVTAYGLV